MFLRNSTDLSELSGTQIVEVGKPGIPGLPNLSFQFHSGGYFNQTEPKYNNYNPFYYEDNGYTYTQINKFIYKPADMFISILDIDSYLLDPKWENKDNYPDFRPNDILKYIKCVPACLSLTRNGQTTYYASILVYCYGQIRPIYFKFNGSLEEFKLFIQKDQQVLSNCYTYFWLTKESGMGPINAVLNDTKLKNQEAPYNSFEISADTLFNPYTEIYNHDEDKLQRYGGLYDKQGIAELRKTFNISLKSEVLELNQVFPFLIDSYSQLNGPIMVPRKFCLCPGQVLTVVDNGSFNIKDTQYYDFALKYHVDDLVDPIVIDGNSSIGVNTCYKAINYGAKSMTEYDKSGNYITEIIVNN